MTALDPEFLWLFVGVAGVVAAYVVGQRLGSRFVVVLPTTEEVRAVAPGRPGWRRHVTAAMFVLALTAMVVALAGPARHVRVPLRLATIMVALDSSRSMGATDVKPERLVAAREAARKFVRALPSEIRVGVVVFAGQASLALAPSGDRAAVIRAVDSAHLQVGTAIGDAISKSLDALQNAARAAGVSARSTQQPLSRAGIVLLSDGDNTSGRTWIPAANAAKAERVRVSTIAFGTLRGTVSVNGRSVSAPVDHASLQAIAKRTGGRAFAAANESDLRVAYQQLTDRLGYRSATQDLTRWFLIGALALELVTVAGAFVWSTRVP
jgi:Ca-activated chloride channel family protein